MNQMYIIFKSLAVIFLIKSVSTLQEVGLNDLNLKTIASLLKAVSKYETDLKYVIIQPNKWKDKQDRNRVGDSKLHTGFLNSLEENIKIQNPKNRTLIKRLIPHGLPPGELEFDNKYKTFYRPLVRVHKKKKLPSITTILNIDGNSNGIDKYGIDMYDYFDNDENVLKFATKKEPEESLKHFKVQQPEENDEELLQPFTNEFTENIQSLNEASAQLILLKDIQNLLRKIRSRSSRIKIYQDIVKVLDKIASLRSPLKSGEDDNDLMVSGGHQHIELNEYKEVPKKKWLPHYPAWNFWTYKKGIYQDACPRGQVKINNLCIWIPPH